MKAYLLPYKNDISERAKKILDKLDYTLFSVHIMGLFDDGKIAEIDYKPENFKRGITEIYGNSENFIKHYFDSIGKMAEIYKPDIIGHIDLIKKNNFNLYSEEEDYYKEALKGALDRIKEAGSIVEINTGGVYRYGMRCFYPSEYALEEILKRDIPITVNGDTHFKDGIDYLYPEVEKLLKRLGFSHIKTFQGQKWQDYRI